MLLSKEWIARPHLEPIQLCMSSVSSTNPVSRREVHTLIRTTPEMSEAPYLCNSAEGSPIFLLLARNQVANSPQNFP